METFSLEWRDIEVVDPATLLRINFGRSIAADAAPAPKSLGGGASLGTAFARALQLRFTNTPAGVGSVQERKSTLPIESGPSSIVSRLPFTVCNRPGGVEGKKRRQGGRRNRALGAPSEF
jgi:hypothetical protein